MAETLGEKRCRFTQDLAKLIQKAKDFGYDVALDQVKRTQAEADANAASGVGIKNSLHLLGLAADLLLYRDGIYLTKDVGYEILGQWWKALSPDHRWGGDFRDAQGRPKPDSDHYSIEHGGVK